MSAPRGPLDDAIDRIRRSYGDGAIMQLGEAGAARIEGLTTGSPSLDRALGGAGFPRGRITEIFGPEASGKTTLALTALAAAQKAGGVGVLVDTEHALHPPFARTLGVDLDRLLLSQPDSGEQALDIADQLIRSGGVDCLVLDSVAALVPAAEIEGAMGDESDPARQARLLSAALRRLVGSISQARTVVILINQIRTRIGTFFGNPETTPGGRALKYYAAVRLDLKPIGVLQTGEARTGIRVRARIVKNKVAAPFRETEFDLLYDRGISREGDVLDLAVEAGVVDRSGEWLSFRGTRLGRGRDAAVETLRGEPDLSGELERAIGIGC